MSKPLNRKQRRLIYMWLFFGTLFGAWIVFDAWVTEHLRLVRFLILLGMPLALLIDNKPTGPVDFDELVEGHAWVKVWMALCCVAILGLYFLTTHSQIRLEEVVGFRIVIIAILVTFGPILVLGSIKRFKEYGAEGEPGLLD